MSDDKEESDKPHIDAMHHREITLEDGRYMIFYTFGETDERDEDSDV